MTIDSKPQRLYWLDILRGLAALSIVLWHWQHFFFIGTLDDIFGTNIDRHQYPFYWVLRPFYGQGWRAVELFFTLSGFVFFWLYAETIACKKVTFKEYMVMRVSRLYPLHLTTLAVVILGQWIYFRRTGNYFVYNDFSISAFLTNLTLTSSWFSTRFSFNGPVWSVSVEMFLYLVFFGFCLLRLNRWWMTLVMIFLGWLLRGTYMDTVGNGMMCFFAGGTSFYLFKFLTIQKRSVRILFIFGAFPVAFCAALIVRYALHRDLPFYLFELGLFPLMLLTVAVGETTFGSGIGRKLHFIGDISYSSYLWHFPLQLVFIITAVSLGLAVTIFNAPLTLALFYLILIAISLASYYGLERPAQKFLRSKFNH